MSLAGNRTAWFLLAGACDSYVSCVHCVALDGNPALGAILFLLYILRTLFNSWRLETCLPDSQIILRHLNCYLIMLIRYILQHTLWQCLWIRHMYPHLFADRRWHSNMWFLLAGTSPSSLGSNEWNMKLEKKTFIVLCCPQFSDKHCLNCKHPRTVDI